MADEAHDRTEENSKDNEKEIDIDKRKGLKTTPEGVDLVVETIVFGKD